VTSFWQQAGRSGRRGQGALIVLIARDDPLDTYLVHHPAALLDKPIERVVIDPANPYVLGPQLLCAATELPIDDAEVRSWDADDVATALGDLTAALPGTSPCGRTNMRIKGWMGRADQTTKVKGMFVRPEQIAEIGKRHPALGRLRLVVTRQGETDAMTLKAEAAAASEALREEIAASLRAVTKLGGAVERARRAGPEQAVVDEHEVGALLARASEQVDIRRDARDDGFDLLAAGHLKSVRPVVVVRGGVEDRVEVFDDRVDRGHSSQP